MGNYKHTQAHLQGSKNYRSFILCQRFEKLLRVNYINLNHN